MSLVFVYSLLELVEKIRTQGNAVQDKVSVGRKPI
jgi:hypothetical protein